MFNIALCGYCGVWFVFCVTQLLQCLAVPIKELPPQVFSLSSILFYYSLLTTQLWWVLDALHNLSCCKIWTWSSILILNINRALPYVKTIQQLNAADIHHRFVFICCTHNLADAFNSLSKCSLLIIRLHSCNLKRQNPQHDFQHFL